MVRMRPCVTPHWSTSFAALSFYLISTLVYTVLMQASIFRSNCDVTISFQKKKFHLRGDVLVRMLPCVPPHWSTLFAFLSFYLISTLIYTVLMPASILKSNCDVTISLHKKNFHSRGDVLVRMRPCVTPHWSTLIAAFSFYLISTLIYTVLMQASISSRIVTSRSLFIKNSHSTYLGRYQPK